MRCWHKSNNTVNEENCRSAGECWFTSEIAKMTVPLHYAFVIRPSLFLVEAGGKTDVHSVFDLAAAHRETLH